MNILLKSPYECLVKTAREECELTPNDTLLVEDEHFVSIYPQEAGRIPFYINLSHLQDCANYSVHVREGKTYIILENFAKFEVKMKENLFFSGKNCQITISNNNLAFEINGKKVSCTCDAPPEDYKVFKIKSFACLQFENNLYAFSTKEGKLYHFSGEIEVDGDQISVTKSFNDASNRQRKSVFRLGDELEILDEQFILPPQKESRALAPYKLLESVKAKDYLAATALLTKKLQEKVNAEQIKAFFGNFTSFLPLSTTEFITMAGKKKSYVSFSMMGQLIDDISVDDF